MEAKDTVVSGEQLEQWVIYVLENEQETKEKLNSLALHTAEAQAEISFKAGQKEAFEAGYNLGYANGAILSGKPN